jgi:hypothetical protein
MVLLLLVVSVVTVIFVVSMTEKLAHGYPAEILATEADPVIRPAAPPPTH